MQNLVVRIVALSVRAPRRVLAAALALALLAGWFGATRFAMTTDAAALIAPAVDWRRDEAARDAAFPQARDLTVVIVDGATPEAAKLAARGLAAALARDPAHIRAVRRPDAGAFFDREGLLFLDRAAVAKTTARLIAAQPFLGPLAADPSLRGVANGLATLADGVASGAAAPADLARPAAALDAALRPVAAGGRAWFSWGSLLVGGDDGLAEPRRRIVLVQPVLDYGALTPGAAADAAVRAAAAHLRLDAAHGVMVRLTGEIPLADEEFASLADGAAGVGAAMAGSMLLLLGWATRSAKMVAAIALTTAAGLVVTAALGLAALGRFNLISVAFVPLFVGLGVDFGIQLCVRVRAEGGATDAALARAAAGLGPSLLVAAGAVAVGFLAFVPTAYVGVAELGVVAAAGMVVALAFSLTLLPALLTLLRPASRGEAGLGWTGAAAWLAAHRRAVLWGFAAALAGSVALLPWVRFDFNPYHLRDPRGPAMAALTDLLADPDRTPNSLDVLVQGEPAARALAARLAALPAVARAVSLDSFVPADQPAKLALIADARDLLDFSLDPPAVAPPPDDAATVAALRRAATSLRGVADPGARRLAATLDALAAAPPARRAAAAATLVPPLDLLLGQLRDLLAAGPVTRATLPLDLVRDWVTPGGTARVQVSPRGDPTDNATLARFTAAVLRVAPHASGPPVSVQAAARTVAGAFVAAGLYALVAIALLLLAVLRSVREVAFTLAPVVLAGFLTLATCVVVGQPINFANIIAFPLLFGVGVAFHIYFVMAWRGGEGALLTSSLARGVLFSALATGAAFGSLWLSHHPGTAGMGKILMISLAWTLVCALVFEPALLGPISSGSDGPRSSRRKR